ncbi:MAG: TAXI family TRAP transporter solute-binding subunit [Rickettsiales bacterium]|nr:TAXI family TRAP transporter solute-binding subunit [Rickettsiales bacterium]
MGRLIKYAVRYCLLAVLLPMSVLAQDVTPITPPVQQPELANKISKTPFETQEALGMVTGSVTGTYYRFGQDISSVLAPRGIDILVKESKGSIDNINRIGSNENAALGIVQSDVLGFLMRSQEAKSREIADNLRMIFPLYREEVHILANKNIKSVEELNGKTVVVGPQGSGSWLTSVNLFGITGVRPGKMLRQSPKEGVVDVLTGRADAMVYVAGKPVKLFTNLKRLEQEKQYAGLLGNVHFLPLNDPKLLKEYAASSITPNDYDFVEQNVPTVAVTALLVDFDFFGNTSDYAVNRCEKLREFGTALKENINRLRETGHPKWKEVDLNAEVGFWRRDRCALGESSATELERELLNTIEQGW